MHKLKNMKIFLTLICCTFFVISHAQDSTNLHAETPKIIRNLKYGNRISIENYHIQFVEVLRDSRCPKGVQCITYGDAIVRVDVFKDGELLESKEIKISPKHYMDETTKLLEVDGEVIYVVGLQPYPIDGKKTAPTDYSIQLLPQKKRD